MLCNACLSDSVMTAQKRGRYGSRCTGRSLTFAKARKNTTPFVGCELMTGMLSYTRSASLVVLVHGHVDSPADALERHVLDLKALVLLGGLNVGYLQHGQHARVLHKGRMQPSGIGQTDALLCCACSSSPLRRMSVLSVGVRFCVSEASNAASAAFSACSAADGEESTMRSACLNIARIGAHGGGELVWIVNKVAAHFVLQVRWAGRQIDAELRHVLVDEHHLDHIGWDAISRACRSRQQGTHRRASTRGITTTPC